MKLDDDEYIYDRDDYGVDIATKKRTYRQYLISKKNILFDPQDLALETNKFDGNPSANKESYNVSSKFRDCVDRMSAKINKGEAKKARMPDRHSLERIFKDLDLDDDYEDDYE